MQQGDLEATKEYSHAFFMNFKLPECTEKKVYFESSEDMECAGRSFEEDPLKLKLVMVGR